MPIVYLSPKEYDALKAVADGCAVRAADLGPWANAETGALIENTLNRCRSKDLALVPARGGTPELTQDGRDSIAAYEARVAEEQGTQR